MTSKIAGCISGYTDKGYTAAEWKVGRGKLVFSGVCRKCFVRCYQCSHSYLDRICSDLKKGEVSSTSLPNFTDHTAGYEYSTTFKKALNDMARKDGNYLNHEQIAALQISNTVQSLSCYAWLSSYFKLTGDVAPNSNNIIHFEPISINEIFEDVSFFSVHYSYSLMTLCN